MMCGRGGWHRDQLSGLGYEAQGPEILAPGRVKASPEERLGLLSPQPGVFECLELRGNM
jgi:hypothetical protein